MGVCGIGACLNAAFVAAELVFGYAANSLALISDAVHNLSDVIALLLAWGAAWLSQKQPTQRHTYGYRRASILAALFNAGLLLVAVGGIVVEAVKRLRSRAGRGTDVCWSRRSASSQRRHGALFMRGRDGDLNIRGAYLHMVADAGVSLGVVVAAGVIMLTGWLWIDPVISLVIAAWCSGGWGLARDSANLALDGAPRGIEPASAGLSRRAAMASPRSTTCTLGHEHHETALTAHLVRPGGTDDAFLHSVCEELSHRFNIHHATLQIETGPDVCKLAPADVV